MHSLKSAVLPLYKLSNVDQRVFEFASWLMKEKETLKIEWTEMIDIKAQLHTKGSNKSCLLSQVMTHCHGDSVLWELWGYMT